MFTYQLSFRNIEYNLKNKSMIKNNKSYLSIHKLNTEMYYNTWD